MQKLINVLALASFAVSGAVVGSGLYVYLNRASIIDGVKSKVVESVTGSLGGGAGLGADTLPLGSNDLSLPTPQVSAPVPAGGLGVSQF